MAPLLFDSVETKNSYVTLLELKQCASSASVQRTGNVITSSSDNYATMRKKIGQSYTNTSVADFLTHRTFDLLSLNNNSVAVLSPSAFDSTLLGRTTLTLGESGPGETILVHVPKDSSVTYIVITSTETGCSYIPGEDIKSINAELISSPSVSDYKSLKFTPSHYDDKSGFGGKKKCVSFVLKNKKPKW